MAGPGPSACNVMQPESVADTMINLADVAGSAENLGIIVASNLWPQSAVSMCA